MLDAALGGSIRETDDSLLLQSDALYLHKNLTRAVLNVKVKAGISIAAFRLYHGVQSAETACAEPFRRYLVGRLGIHVNEALAFFTAIRSKGVFLAGLD